MRGLFRGRANRRIAAYQGDLIEKHYAEVENIYRQMRGWKHDFHNHIQAMQVLAGDVSPELSAYLRGLNDDLSRVDTLVKSGNVMVDAIVNSKLSLAMERGISVNVRVFVPKALAIPDVDLCVILGNLIDNATEACERIADAEGRFIWLYMDVMKEQLYISVTNASPGRPKWTGKTFATAKEGNHGMGLLRVDQVVARHKGYVNRQHEEGVFATEVLLPL